MKSMGKPLVTIILTAYNQEKYIGETLHSIGAQTYGRIQLIVIDNASTDDTFAVVKQYSPAVESFRMITNNRNLGLCRAFNQGLAMADGKYIIDLSGDDLFCPERIDRQVSAFEELDDGYAVIFSNAGYIDEEGNFVKNHFEVNTAGNAIEYVPSGDVYKNVLEKYFICTPTMMFRTSVLKEMNGYDETLDFEDFDFWIRSAVRYKYFYQDEILTQKRVVTGSLGTRIYQKGNGMLKSCYTVCNKAYDLNRDQEEFDLLAARIRTFIRKCWYVDEFELALKFRNLLNFIESPGFRTEIIVFFCKIRLPVNSIYQFYLRKFHKYLAGRKVLAPGVVKSES
jgi:glycosyltransferase involved in cell wall biosynthesis